jgi:hypothetical protein
MQMVPSGTCWPMIRCVEGFLEARCTLDARETSLAACGLRVCPGTVNQQLNQCKIIYWCWRQPMSLRSATRDCHHVVGSACGKMRHTQPSTEYYCLVHAILSSHLVCHLGRLGYTHAPVPQKAPSWDGIHTLGTQPIQTAPPSQCTPWLACPTTTRPSLLHISKSRYGAHSIHSLHPDPPLPACPV